MVSQVVQVSLDMPSFRGLVEVSPNDGEGEGRRIV